ncbi:hypothetical protein EJ03DRAFT_174559 [Teratosphaeria nubilosa]|uniref:Uncharacterized protein n=1 Tax=Teratosphaeria nubilosa TaxID=161662 RepID=A0A6G1L2G4_9PEZI|nr:hypothetical protein EJ03DRAFT_174559 [Teratosphaeria nubilosa]
MGIANLAVYLWPYGVKRLFGIPVNRKRASKPRKILRTPQNIASRRQLSSRDTYGPHRLPARRVHGAQIPEDQARPVEDQFQNLLISFDGSMSGISELNSRLAEQQQALHDAHCNIDSFQESLRGHRADRRVNFSAIIEDGELNVELYQRDAREYGQTIAATLKEINIVTSVKDQTFHDLAELAPTYFNLCFDEELQRPWCMNEYCCTMFRRLMGTKRVQQRAEARAHMLRSHLASLISRRRAISTRPVKGPVYGQQPSETLQSLQNQ